MHYRHPSPASVWFGGISVVLGGCVRLAGGVENREPPVGDYQEARTPLLRPPITDYVWLHRAMQRKEAW